MIFAFRRRPAANPLLSLTAYSNTSTKPVLEQRSRFPLMSILYKYYHNQKKCHDWTFIFRAVLPSVSFSPLWSTTSWLLGWIWNAAEEATFQDKLLALASEIQKNKSNSLKLKGEMGKRDLYSTLWSSVIYYWCRMYIWDGFVREQDEDCKIKERAWLQRSSAWLHVA